MIWIHTMPVQYDLADYTIQRPQCLNKKGVTAMPVCSLEHNAIFYEATDPAFPAGTVLFIHGSGADWESWREQLPALPPGFLGIAIDLPGHGRSPGPALDSVPDLAALIILLIKHLNPPRPLILAGHSLGAAIVLQSSSQDGQSMDGLIMLGGGARMRVLPAFLDQLAVGSVDPGFFRLAFAPEASPALLADQLNRFAGVTPDLLFSDFTACNDFDLSDNLQSVVLPVLLLVGEHDRLTPPKNSEFLRDKLTQAELVTIPTAGHFAMLEQPELVNQAIRDYLARFV